jgi:transcriptional regulator with XRE-family HTH domain
MGNEEFIAWLQEQLTQRGWDQAELARRSRITTAHISRLLTGENQPGPEACVKLARALQLPPEEGLLPRTKSTPEGVDGLLYYFTQVEEEDRRRILAMARAVYQLNTKK